jgi:hypothetical protein
MQQGLTRGLDSCRGFVGDGAILAQRNLSQVPCDLAHLAPLITDLLVALVNTLDTRPKHRKTSRAYEVLSRLIDAVLLDGDRRATDHKSVFVS